MNQKHKRTIKFRAWDSKDKIRWLPLSFNEILKGFWGLETKNQELSLPYSDYLYHSHEDTIWMQFTGLKDKNGVEIYEGDIIVWSGTLDDCIFNHVCEVIFDLYQWCGWAIYSPQQKSTIPFGEHGCNPNEVNVVGNAYENKELLKTN